MAPRVTWPLLLLGVLLAGPAFAQPTSDGPTYSKQRGFQIPFQTDPGERRIKTVHLYVSEDLGRTWLSYASTAPEQRHFKFQADRDGQFWFAVQTVDFDSRAHPPSMTNAQPGLKVIVDTQPPSITLRALTPREGAIGVEWDVRDDNLDPASLRLESRSSVSGEWQAIGVVQVTTGTHYWNPGTNGPVEVRLRARDKADNTTESKVTIGSGGVSNPIAEDRRSVAESPGGLGVRMVNSKRISLDYKIEDLGPSGLAAVEFWYTTDGRNWQKFKEYPEPQHPDVLE